MTDRAAEHDVEVIRYYTAARRIPIAFGRFRDGMKIPGGPYSGTQLAAAVTVFVIGQILLPLLNVNIVLALFVNLIAAWGAALLMGSLPTSFRNPVMVASDALYAMSLTGAGSYRGRRILVPKASRGPQRNTGTATEVEIIRTEPARVEIAAEQHRFVAPAMESVDGTPIVTGLDRLRSLANERKENQ